MRKDDFLGCGALLMQSLGLNACCLSFQRERLQQALQILQILAFGCLEQAMPSLVKSLQSF